MVEDVRETPPELAQRYWTEGLWSDETLGSMLAEGLGRHPQQPIRVWSQRWPCVGTYGSVVEMAQRFAGGLHQLGIREGDVVAFQLPNWIEAAVTFYGLTMLGAVLVPVAHFYGRHELAYILEESSARLLVTADRFGRVDYLDGITQPWPGLPQLETVVVVGESVPGPFLPFDRLLDAEPLAVLAAPDPGAPVVLPYTSGTSANPKGVVYTHRSLCCEVRHHIDKIIPRARPALTGSPVSHITGMLVGLLVPVLRGDALHLTDAWETDAAIRAIDEGQLSIGSAAPIFLTSLLDHPDFRPEHAALIGAMSMGGANVPTAVVDRAEAAGISIRRSYGCTEHPSTSGAYDSSPRYKRNTTDGIPLAGVDVQVRDLSGTEVAPGDPGQLFVRGPDLCAGYTNPQSTAEAFDRDGWFATGDVGYLDEDGWIVITDRVKDIIIRNGVNVSAAEVENALLRLPGVAEVAVVAQPDARVGERGCGVIRLTDASQCIALPDLQRHLEEVGLARPKWPEAIRLVDDFPRTPSGKIKKYVLREQVALES